jgi:hypothetical protein
MTRAIMRPAIRKVDATFVQWRGSAPPASTLRRIVLVGRIASRSTY